MTMTPLSVQRIAPDDWPGISRGFRDLTYEQSLTYGRAAADRIGADTEFVTLGTATEQPVAAACIRIKRVPGLNRGIAWIVSGPLIEPLSGPAPGPDDLHRILAALRSHVHRAGHTLRLRLPAISAIPPADATRAALQSGFTETTRAAGYHTVAFDLSLPEDALFKALHGKWRNPLRNALKAGLELEHGPMSAMSGRFQTLFDEVRETKGFQPGIPPEVFYDLQGSDFDHDVLIARHEGCDVAAFTVARSGTRATYLYGATSETGRRLNAGHFLMWQAALHCAALGCDWLDLGGMSVEDNPSVARFKQRTGGRELAAAGPFEAVAPGAIAGVVLLAEALHKRLKGAR